MTEQNTLEKLHQDVAELKGLMLAQKEVLDIDELALYVGLSKTYIYKLTHSNKIPFYKPGGKKIYFKRSEVDNWLLSNRVSTDEELEHGVDNYLVGLKKAS